METSKKIKNYEQGKTEKGHFWKDKSEKGQFGERKQLKHDVSGKGTTEKGQF